MRLTFEITHNVEVADVTFHAIEKFIGSREVALELVGTIAMYNTGTRFLVALCVGDDQ